MNLANSNVPAAKVFQVAIGDNSTSKLLDNKTFGELFTEYLRGDYSGGKDPVSPFVQSTTKTDTVAVGANKEEKTSGASLLDDLNAATGVAKQETVMPSVNPTGGTTVVGSGEDADKAYNAQISKSISDIEAKYGDLYSHIKETDYTQKPYYKTIMESYGIAGDDAADAESASGAGANGGNLDSYAAANARRQRLAFANAGQSAALAAYNAEIGNLLNTLNSLGVNVNDLYATWSGDLSSQRENATNRYLGELDSETQKYVSDNQLTGTKYVSDKDSETQKYVSDNQLTGTKYVSDKDSETQKYVSDNQLAGTKYVSDKDSETQKYVSDNQLTASKYAADTERYMAELASADNRYAIDANSADARYLAQLDVTMQESANDLQRYLAQLDFSNQALDREAQAKANEEANALTKYIADLEAETERYGVDKNAETQLNLQNAKNALAMYELLLSGSGADVEDMEGGKTGTDVVGAGEKRAPTYSEKAGAAHTYEREGESGLKNYLVDLPADVDLDAVMDYAYREQVKRTVSGGETPTLSRGNSNKTATALF